MVKIKRGQTKGFDWKVKKKYSFRFGKTFVKNRCYFRPFGNKTWVKFEVFNKNKTLPQHMMKVMQNKDEAKEYYNLALEKVKAQNDRADSFGIYMKMMKITGAAQKRQQPVQRELF